MRNDCDSRWLRVRAIAALVALVALAPAYARAESAADMVSNGNKAFADGNFSGALSEYDRAAAEVPDSAHVQYDRGAALYEQDDWKGAAAAFNSALENLDDASLKARSMLGLGNCMFRSAQQQSSDPESAIESLEVGTRYYRRALELEPWLTVAGENLEVARLAIKGLQQRVREQEQASEKRGQAAEKLKELLDRQQQAAAESERLEQQQRENGDSPEQRQAAGGLSEKQEELEKETEALARELGEAGEKDEEQGAAAEQLQGAVADQESAAEALKQSKPAEAREDQDAAAEHMADALAKLGKQGDDEKKKEERREEQAPEQAGDQQDAREQETQELPEEALDILNKEQENRQQPRMGGYEPVDKDW